jgi:spermidine synthase
VDLLATYTGRASDLQPMVSGVALNEDMNLRLQYLAGMGLNSRHSAEIYRRILTYRQFPQDLLTGEGERMNALHNLLGRAYRSF